MPRKFDLVTLGDCAIDLFLAVDDSTQTCDIDTKKCVVSFTYGDKIAVDSFDRTLAGNCANVAVGASRLGLKTGFWTVVGDDASGKELIDGMKAEGVDTKHMHTDKTCVTNTHVVIHYSGERIIFVYHNPYTYPEVKLPNTDWLYFSSTSKEFVCRHPKFLKEIDAKKVKLGFNPGTYQMKLGMKKIKPFIKRCTAFFVNKDEASRLLDKSITTPIRELLFDFRKIGAKHVYITDGVAGAYATNGEDFLYVPSVDRDSVEATGAGDSFATGALAALIRGESLETSLRWGVTNASSVIKHVGAQRGLLTEAQMKMYLNKYKHLKVSRIK